MFKSFFKRNEKHLEADKEQVKAFRKRYASFRRLLEANAALGELLADMEDKLQGKSMFGIVYIRTVAKKAIALTRKMAQSLEEMRPGRYTGLFRPIDEVEEALRDLIDMPADECAECPGQLVIALSEMDLSMAEWVGGKNANLGEMVSMVGLPVPPGFAITVGAYHSFIRHNGLAESIEDTLGKLDTEDRDGLAVALEDIRQKIEEAPLPPALAEVLDKARNKYFSDNNCRIAVRSSALSEDGEKSFAGQFLSVLGVLPEALEQSYKKVIASLFTPSATLYRLHQGISLADSAMAVACLCMVDASVSGVAYSHDPVNPGLETVVINGVYGLGSYLVDGVVTPDTWVFSRADTPELVRKKKGDKFGQLVMGPDGQPFDMPVSEALRNEYCMTDAKAAELADMVLLLEEHFGGYQDVEWAIDKEGKLWLLQARPLSVSAWSARRPDTPRPDHALILMDGGEAAYHGVGFGGVFMPKSPEDLLHFPAGGVLVTRHSSPEYAEVMDKAQAIITETGGITGHMATLAREYRVPTLMNMPGILQRLKPGMPVTVDAFAGRVYSGIIEELKPLKEYQEPVRLLNTPVYVSLRRAAEYISHLNLTDPSSAEFSPAGCRTLHDVMRYSHEMSYQEMFAISDSASSAGGVSMKLRAPLPIDLHLIDLDGGTAVGRGAQSVTPEEITSAPLKALLKGMLNPAVMFRKPRPVNMGGFISVMSQQMANPKGGDGRFGDRSYAIISDRYMNFSSRVGYHYSVLDSYCGMTMSKNYIAFNFQGGAAGEVRRVRRARAIALVLEELGFTVVVQGDAVKSRFQKYEKSVIEDRLDHIGRLLQVTRQMDMLMVSDAAVRKFKEDFMNGVYQ